MSRKKVSSKERDPSLTNGRGYFVEDDAYQLHIEANALYRQPASRIFKKNELPAINKQDSQPPAYLMMR
jgi:hypothetical protein